MPNLFGEIDAADVQSDPFYLAPGTYDCVVTEAALVEKKDGTGQGLSFRYTVQDDDSPYNGNSVQEWKNVWPNLTEEELTPEISRQNSFLKMRLAQLGIPEVEMNNILDNLDSLVGIECVVTVTENPSKDGTRTYTNVRSVSLPDIYGS